MPSRKKKFFFVLRVAVFGILGVVGLLLWILDRGLPRPVVRRLERELSSGPFAYRFDHASFNLFNGIVLRDARIHVKHGLGAPLLKVDELQLRLRYYRGRPFYFWIYGATAKGLVCQPFDDLPTSGGASIDPWLAQQEAWAVPIHITFLDSSIFSVAFQRLDLDLSLRDGDLLLDNIRLGFFSRGFSETLNGNVRVSLSGNLAVHGRLAGTLTPEVIEDVTDFLGGEGAIEYYRYLDQYSSPLDVAGEVTWISAGEREDVSATQDMRVTVKATDVACNGVPLQALSLGLQWLVPPPDSEGRQQRRLTLSPIRCVTAEGKGDFAVAWYPREHKTELSATSTLPIWDISKIIDIPFPAMFTNFVFQTPPSAELSGRIYGGDLVTNSTLSGKLTSGPVRVYGFDFQNLSARADVEGFRDIHIRDVLASTAYGGDVSGRLDLSFPEDDGDPAFDLDAKIHDIDFGRIRHHLILSDSGRPGGRVDGTLSIHGVASTNRLDTFGGSAKATVRNSLIFRVPVFAGLTDFIARNVPGVDLLFMQSSADLKATATNGLVTVERFNVEGNLLSMVADGKWRLNKAGHPVEGVARIRLFKQRTLAGRLARILIWPVNKMMELRVSGPIADPGWSYIGLIDRVKDATFWSRKDATDLEPEKAPAPVSPWEKEGERAP